MAAAPSATGGGGCGCLERTTTGGYPVGYRGNGRPEQPLGVLPPYSEGNEKNTSTEEGLTACVEAKIEKSEDNGSMGKRDKADVEGKEPCSLHTESEKDASHEKVMTVS
ncbi:hypothetical protein JOB18_008547 [Solea senegalensis]|uniref:Uncharacterized protein n=1 Tax=Solea senegalensis TaxID=28829 RepID=A0AAV6RM54_SOLSE|nr:hypothetical protein JOB18_008547 [Solea senegalensis]